MKKIIKLNNQTGYSHEFYTVNFGVGSFNGDSKRRGVQCFVLDNSGTSVCL